jgi:hypothetical protein
MGRNMNKRISSFQSIITLFKGKFTLMSAYMNEHSNSQFILHYKYLTHSDLLNRGKKCGNQSLKKNLLYYLTVQEMIEIEKKSGKEFENAKQSNIGLMDSFFSDIGIERLRRRRGSQNTQHEHVELNNTIDVYVVKESLKYFKREFTEIIFNKTNKEFSSYFRYIFEPNTENDFVPISITHAIHGVGTSSDIEFTSIREHLFKNDIVYFLIEIPPTGRKKLFILCEKNPVFFTLVENKNIAWEEYKHKELEIRETNASILEGLGNTDDKEEKNRSLQSKWRTLLAAEMMNYTSYEGQVFCPFTFISAAFEKASILFVASHIKSFSDCSDMNEIYDLNNGLLLTANADKLFDNHYITVNEEKELEFSFLIKDDKKLLTELKLNQEIFKLVLNDKRMEYLRWHKDVFDRKEKYRSQNII